MEILSLTGLEEKSKQMQIAALRAQNTAAQYQLQQAQYQQSLAGTGNQTTGGLDQLGNPLGGHVPTWSTTTYTPATMLTAIPPASGQYSTIAFTDAIGQIWSVIVDASFIPILNQINTAHASRFVYPKGQYPQLADPIGDFSLEEMDVAEQLIEELDGQAHQD